MDTPERSTAAIDAASVLASALDCIICMDHEGCITEFNPAAEATFGFQRADVLGRDMAELTIPERYRERHREGLRRYLAGEVGSVIGNRIEIAALRSDGTEFPVELTVARIGASISPQFIGFIRDITEQKRTERDLRRSEELLHDFFENATVALHWVNAEGVIIRVNRAELNLLGYSADEYIGHHISEFHVDPLVIDDILRRLSAGEELHSYEAWLRCKDGSTRCVLISSNVLWDEGRFIHTRCFTRDVTERRRTEDALRESEARYAAIYRREALLNSIGHAIRTLSAPESIQAVAVKLLGEALHLDRCFFNGSMANSMGIGQNVAHDEQRPLLPDFGPNASMACFRC